MGWCVNNRPGCDPRFYARYSSGRSLGLFATAEEAALAVAQDIGPEASAAAAAEALAPASKELTPQEVRAQVDAEGLTLVPSTSSCWCSPETAYLAEYGILKRVDSSTFRQNRREINLSGTHTTTT